MFVGLNREDPGQAPISPEHMRRTLRAFREAPSRGTAIVLEVRGGPVGYALLLPYWSNELGGACCVIDELFVSEALRGQGHATALIRALAAGVGPWPHEIVAVCLEVARLNEQARALYRRLGFVGDNLALRLPRVTAQ